MTHKNKGFTLIELMAVIAILAIIVTIASVSVTNVMKSAKEKASEDMRNSLKDIAITSVLGEIHLSKCSESFSKEIESGNITNLAANKNCTKEIKVSELKNSNLFEDEKGYCSDNETIIVYRYNVSGNTEYRAYISNNACTNY